jgi:hypothetical protein
MQITRRERLLFVFGGAFVVALLYYLIGITPALSKQDSLAEAIKKKETSISEMIQIQKQWNTFAANKKRAEGLLKRRGKDFTLLSYLEGISRKVEVSNNVQYMKPLALQSGGALFHPVGIEVGLENINTNQLIKYLYEIEYSDKLLAVERIRIQQVSKGKTQTLKVILQVNTFEQK